MKKQIGYLALAACAFGLQACGGSMLDTPDSEKHKLVPEPVQGDEGRPRPSDNAPVLSSDGAQLLDATGEPVLLRGVNLQYGDNPLDRINGITSIGEVGSNVVRLQLRADTTADELEAALLTAVEADLVVMVTYWEPDVECAADDDALFGAVNDLWLNEWVPVLVQDRFQPHVMLNLASKWGPTGIFNAYSQGYRIYIDNYKAVIRQMRRAGFRNPIVVDAPGCGQDYHAFLGNRGRELLASDDEENIVLSVHAYGSHWRGAEEVATAMEQLAGEDMPVVMSEFGDKNAEEDAVRHTDIIVKGAGDNAAELAIDWQTDADKAGYVAVLDKPLDLYGREVSMEVYLDAAYVESEQGFLGMQMYLRDGDDRYANLGWNSADTMEGDSWNSIKRVIQDNSSFGWADEGFDASTVTKMGLELVANGKSPEVGGDIRIDNIKVIEASVPETLGVFSFDADLEGWAVPWTETELVHEDESLGLIRAADSNEVITESPALEGVNFEGEIQVSARLFIPESYAADTEGLYFKFFNNGAAEWEETNTLTQDQVTFGEWNEISLSGEFTAGSKVGIQAGNLAGSQEPILVDDIEVLGVPEQETDVEWGTQYQSDFSEGTDGWGVLGWHTLPVSVSAEEGALVLAPRPSEIDDASEDDNRTFAVQKNELGSIENLDLTSEELTVTVSLQLDAAYSEAPEDFEFRIFMQDVDWSHTNLAVWTLEELTPGEWNTMEFDMVFPEEFERNGTPKLFGFQVFGVSDMPDAPITVGEVRIEGYVPMEVEEEVVELIDFHYPEHLDNLEVDFVEGGLVDADLLEGITVHERSEPFSWLAWSWIGNPEGMEVLDMSNSEDTSVDLTERGEQIVNGKGGIMETAVPANFPATE